MLLMSTPLLFSCEKVYRWQDGKGQASGGRAQCPVARHLPVACVAAWRADTWVPLKMGATACTTLQSWVLRGEAAAC